MSKLKIALIAVGILFLAMTTFWWLASGSSYDIASRSLDQAPMARPYPTPIIIEPGLPTPPALVYCPDVQRRLSEEDCDDLHQALVRAREGVAAFNVPDQLLRGDPTTIQLAVAFDGARYETSILRAGDGVLESSSSGGVEHPQTPFDVVRGLPGSPKSYAPMVGRDMKAELLGEGFTIEPLTEAQQHVGDIGVTTWEWKVTALEKGPHTLTLKTVVEGVTADGKKYPLIPTIRNQTVNVNLSWDQKVFDVVEGLPAWLKVFTAALTAITALLTAYFGLRALFGKRTTANDPKPKD